MRCLAGRKCAIRANPIALFRSHFRAFLNRQIKARPGQLLLTRAPIASFQNYINAYLLSSSSESENLFESRRRNAVVYTNLLKVSPPFLAHNGKHVFFVKRTSYPAHKTILLWWRSDRGRCCPKLCDPYVFIPTQIRGKYMHALT